MKTISKGDMPITNGKILKWSKQIANLKLRIIAEQRICQHSDEILDTHNDHDGYSFVMVNWYETRRCKNCGRIETVFTSTSGPGY